MMNVKYDNQPRRDNNATIPTDNDNDDDAADDD
jgi:hypothetical protein